MNEFWEKLLLASLRIDKDHRIVSKIVVTRVLVDLIVNIMSCLSQMVESIFER